MVHAAALLALSRMPIRVPAPPSAPIDEVSIEMTPEPEGTVAAPEPSAKGEKGEKDRPSAAMPPRAAVAMVETPRARAASPAEESSPPANGDGTVTLPRMTNESPDLALGGVGANPFLPKSEAAVALAESKRGVDRALKDPARERETSLGLGPEGPVLTALVEATARSTAPVRGKAVFVATADESGVFGIELRDAEGSRAGWDDARTIALAALKGKKLRLPAGATRAVMRIEVKSDWKLPSGHDPNPEVTLFHVPLKKGETKESAKVSILDPIPKLRVVELQIDQNTKVPFVSLQIDLFSTNMDPTDIGAKPRRVVHSHLLDSQVM